MGMKRSLSAPPDLSSLRPFSQPPPRSPRAPSRRPLHLSLPPSPLPGPPPRYAQTPLGAGDPGPGGPAGSPPWPRLRRSPAAAILVPMETAARAGSESGSGGWRTRGAL